MVHPIAANGTRGLDSHSMKTASAIETEVECRRSPLTGFWRVLWNAIRLHIAAVLLLLEPVVGFIFVLGLLLGVLASILFDDSPAGPPFPLAAPLRSSP